MILIDPIPVVCIHFCNIHICVRLGPGLGGNIELNNYKIQINKKYHIYLYDCPLRCIVVLYQKVKY